MPLAASIERAVTDAAVLLLIAGAVLALAWGLLYRRLGLLQWPLLVIVVGALGAGTALGAWAWYEDRPRTVRGTSTEEFVNELRPGPRPDSPLLEEQWPTYGFDEQRTHLAPVDWRIRPPFHGLWQLSARGDLEFPPSVAYGKVYVPQQKGRFFVVNARTGKPVWARHFPNCVASSPTISGGIVYQGFMDTLPCAQARGGGPRLRHRLGRGHRPPALALRRRLGRVVAAARRADALLRLLGPQPLRARARGKRRPRVRWTFQADDQIVAAPAYSKGTVYIATSNGSIYGVHARSGRERWHATSFSRFGSREYFYATPDRRVRARLRGNADGTVYAYGAASGHLLWARQVGTYVYRRLRSGGSASTSGT